MSAEEQQSDFFLPQEKKKILGMLENKNDLPILINCVYDKVKDNNPEGFLGDAIGIASVCTIFESKLHLLIKEYFNATNLDDKLYEIILLCLYKYYSWHHMQLKDIRFIFNTATTVFIKNELLFIKLYETDTQLICFTIIPTQVRQSIRIVNKSILDVVDERFTHIMISDTDPVIKSNIKATILLNPFQKIESKHKMDVMRVLGLKEEDIYSLLTEKEKSRNNTDLKEIQDILTNISPDSIKLSSLYEFVKTLDMGTTMFHIIKVFLGGTNLTDKIFTYSFVSTAMKDGTDIGFMLRINKQIEDMLKKYNFAIIITNKIDVNNYRCILYNRDDVKISIISESLFEKQDKIWRIKLDDILTIFDVEAEQGDHEMYVEINPI